MKNSTPLRVLVLLATLAAASAAQRTTGLSPAEELLAHEREMAREAALPSWRSACGLSRVDGALWGAGADYKVRFHGRGIVFHAALGRAVERNQTFAFELDSIRRGDGFVLVTDGEVTPVDDDLTVRYHRGGGVVETYAVEPDGVEQSFVFAMPPPGSGELVVRGRIASELPLPARAESDAELRLERPGVGGVRIGAVTGIDAEGRTAAGRLRLDGAFLELWLPAEFVDAATYPLTLDPKIGVEFPVAGGGNDDVYADVAYDESNDLYLVAWQREFSSTDVDIRGLRVTAKGTVLSGLVLIESGTAVGLHPTVASVNVSNRFLAVWQQGSSIFGPFDLRGRSIASVDGSQSVSVAIATDAASEVDPDAAGEPSGLDDDALVVWEELGGGIHGTQVAVPSIGNPSAHSPFTLSVDDDDSRPAIARTTDEGGLRLVVWQRAFDIDHDIRGSLVDRNGGILTTKSLVTSVGPDEEDPDVDGDGSSWVVAYEREEELGSGDNDIRGVHVTWNGLQLEVGEELLFEADANDDEIDPAVAYAGAKTFVAWSDAVAGLDYDLLALAVDPKSCVTCETETLVALLNFENGAEMASQLSGSTSGGDGVLLVWHSAAEVPPFDGDIQGQLLEAIGSGGSSSNVGGGCGDGGSPKPLGAIAVGNPDFEYGLSQAAPTATLGVLVVGAPGKFMKCGPCEILLPDLLFTTTLSSGSGKVSLPIPCKSGLLGAEVEFQWAVYPDPPGTCSLFKGWAFSDRVLLTVGL